MTKKTKTSSRAYLKKLRRPPRSRLFVLGALCVVLVAGAGVYFVSSSLAFTPCSKKYDFGMGNTGSCVSIIQRTLRNYGMTTGSNYFKYSPKSVLTASFVDSIFGPNTHGQIENFQRWQGIQVDGVVGPQTWGQLCSLPFSDISKTDRYNACGY